MKIQLSKVVKFDIRARQLYLSSIFCSQRKKNHFRRHPSSTRFENYVEKFNGKSKVKIMLFVHSMRLSVGLLSIRPNRAWAPDRKTCPRKQKKTVLITAIWLPTESIPFIMYIVTICSVFHILNFVCNLWRWCFTQISSSPSNSYSLANNSNKFSTERYHSSLKKHEKS